MSGRAPFGSRGRGESDGWADVIDDPDDYVNAFSEGPVHSFCSSPSLLLFYLFIHLVLRLAAHSVGAQFPSVRMLDSGNRKKRGNRRYCRNLAAAGGKRGGWATGHRISLPIVDGRGVGNK